jgi:opacity protein-like surface antigen
MKTKLFTVIAIAAMGLLSVGSTSAQLSHGPVAGLNLANVGGDDAEDNSMLIGFHVGWGVNFNLTESISLQPQLLYSVKGAKLDTGDDDAPFALSYIEIPIWGRYNLESGLHFDFGPYIGFLMGAKFDGESEDGAGNKYKDNYTGTDFGIGVGAGYELESGLGFALNYNLGLSNIADYEGGDLTNNVIKFSISYTLGGE